MSISSPTTMAAEAEDAQVSLHHVRMAYSDREVFRELSCSFPPGKMSVILGGSGSGKSTILRLIGGLVQPQAGSIMVAGEDVTRLSERRLYAVRKKLGMMFQGGALLDSMTVFDNLAFPLREHARMSEEKIAREVHERLDAVGLADVDELLPGELSGGMVKRVALARAIMMKPVILLCDEPFSGLDPISAQRIEALLVAINQQFGMTVVLVSHSVPSTMRIAERVLLLLPDGAIEGSPTELQESPDPRVATFLNGEFDDESVPAGSTPGRAGRSSTTPTWSR